MKKPFWHQELFGLLYHCERNEVYKSVLDCGAGGPRPPLAIFKEHGFETFGIDISDRSIESARKYEEENNVKLNIVKGDMRKLECPDNHFGVVYSYNTIFHMLKKEINESIKEMVRVLKPGGLLYFNLMTTDVME